MPVPRPSVPRNRSVPHRRSILRDHGVRSGGVILAGLGAGLLVAATAVPAQAAGSSYVALGDSYSSGTGTRTYLNDGTACQRSIYAYPSLIASAAGYALNFRACSGATIPDVTNTQLSALGSGTAYVTLSVGGNDAGFADSTRSRHRCSSSGTDRPARSGTAGPATSSGRDRSASPGPARDAQSREPGSPPQNCPPHTPKLPPDRPRWIDPPGESSRSSQSGPPPATPLPLDAPATPERVWRALQEHKKSTKRGTS